MLQTRLLLFFSGKKHQHLGTIKMDCIFYNYEKLVELFLIFENDNLSFWCFKQFAFFEM